MKIPDAKSYCAERQAAWLYRIIAEKETDPAKQQLFLQLAERAETQATLWAKQMKAQGGGSPSRFNPSWRARLVAKLVRLVGPRPLRRILASMKIRGLSVYLHGFSTREHPFPTSAEQIGLRHKSIAGGNLRAAVFGINDGLVSNTSLILGIAGAGNDVDFLILSGVAGLLAGALSMAAGEYVSMRSQRDLYEHQIDFERAEVALYPEEEAEELALIYAARGMDRAHARRYTAALMREPERALEVLAREELGLNPDELGSPSGAAIFSFFSFAAGAAIPLIPFLAGLERSIGIAASAGLAAGSLFLVGAVLSLFTGKNALLSGLRMLLIGGSAGLLTHAIGHLWGGVATGL